MKQVVDILKAAGEDTRLRIIALLKQGELAVQEIVNVLGLSQPRISRHIKLLFEAGIITKRAEGAWVFAKLTNDASILSIVSPIISAIADDDKIIAKDSLKLAEIRKARDIVAQNYFDAIAPEWESLRKLQQPDQAVEDAMKEMVKDEHFSYHIDFGSGTGELLAAFAYQSDISEGIDKSRSMLALARSNLDEIKDGSISVRIGDILNAPYSDNTADFVTIHQVLHYLDDPIIAIKEAARVLKSNGTLLLADFSPHQFEELREKYGHKRLGFALSELEEMCTNSGFEIIETKLIGAAPNKQNAPLNVNVLKLKLLQKQMIIDAPINNNSEVV